MNTDASIRAELFRAVARFCASGGGLSGLDGVLIEPAAAGGVLLIAGDGHDLVVARDARGVTDERMVLRVPRPVLAAIDDEKRRATPGMRIEPPRIEVRGGRVWLKPADLNVPFTPAKVAHTDWRAMLRIVEKSTEDAHPNFSARSLDRIKTLAEALARIGGADADAASQSRIVFKASAGIAAAEFIGQSAFVLSFPAIQSDAVREAWTSPAWAEAA